MKLVLARPEHAPTISAFYHALHGADFPYEELLVPQNIIELMRTEEIALILAQVGNELNGIGLGFPRTWNQSFEISSLSVADVPQRNQIGKALFEGLRRFGLNQYGVVYFRVKTDSSFQRGRKIGANCWGFWPEPGALTYEDAELLMGFLSEKSAEIRILPPDNLVTHLPFCRSILRSLEGGQTGVPYPRNFPVGAPRGTGAMVISGRIWPTYHARGNFVTIEGSAGSFPMDIIREFVDKIRTKGINDIRLALPVNHQEAFEELLDYEFRPVAYLPGWFLRGPYRFDCIEMVSGLPTFGGTRTSFVAQAVERVAAGFSLQY